VVILFSPGRNLVIVGCGAFGRETLMWSKHENNGIISRKYTNISVVCDDFDKNSYVYMQKYYRSTLEDYTPGKNDRLVIAVADPGTRYRIYQKLMDRGAKFGRVIHPTAIISNSSKIGEGSIIAPNVVITTDVNIGHHVHINIASSIGHDVTVGDFVTLSSHVDITGHCKLNSEVFMGSGSRILPNCEIARGSRVGAGCTVMRSIKEKATLLAPTPKTVKFSQHKT